MSSWIRYNSTNGYTFTYKWNDSGKLDPQKTTNKRMKHKLLSYGPFEDRPKSFYNDMPIYC